MTIQLELEEQIYTLFEDIFYRHLEGVVPEDCHLSPFALLVKVRECLDEESFTTWREKYIDTMKPIKKENGKLISLVTRKEEE